MSYDEFRYDPLQWRPGWNFNGSPIGFFIIYFFILAYCFTFVYVYPTLKIKKFGDIEHKIITCLGS